MLFAGLDRPETGSCRAPDHLVGHRGRRDINVAGRDTEQRVANRATDDTRFLAIAVQDRQHRRKRPNVKCEQPEQAIVPHR
jgi:hypothetical protein